jgi:hypothetical protein
VDPENVALGFDVRQGKLDFPVDAARPNQGRVEGFNLVGGHDHFYVAALVKPVQLVQQLEHGALDFLGAARLRVVALRADRVDFVDEHDGGRVVVRDAKKFSDQLGPVAEVLLNQLGPHHAQKRGRSLVRHGLGEQGFARAWLAVQNHALRRPDPHLLGGSTPHTPHAGRKCRRNRLAFSGRRKTAPNSKGGCPGARVRGVLSAPAHLFVKLRVREGQLHGFFDLLDLRLEAANVRVRLGRGLVDFHDGHHGVRVVAQNAHHLKSRCSRNALKEVTAAERARARNRWV